MFCSNRLNKMANELFNVEKCAIKTDQIENIVGV